MTDDQPEPALAAGGARSSEAGALPAIVLLGAAAGPGGPSRALRARVDRAADLRGEGSGGRVLCTGLPEEIEWMRRLLAERGVRSALIDELPARNTRENLAAARRWVGAGETVLVVSSPYHLRRVLEEADRQGIFAIGCPSRRVHRPRGRRARARFRLAILRDELRELIARWVYRLSWELPRSWRR